MNLGLTLREVIRTQTCADGECVVGCVTDDTASTDGREREASESSGLPSAQLETPGVTCATPPPLVRGTVFAPVPPPRRAGTSIKSLALDCLLDGGGDLDVLARRGLLAQGGFVFVLGRFMRCHGVAPKGVIHLGAHTGQESVPYLMMGFERVLYCEPHPEAFEKLQKTLAQLGLLESELSAFLGLPPRTQFAALQLAAAARDGEGPLFRTRSSRFASTRRPSDFAAWVAWVNAGVEPREAEAFARWAATETQVTGTMPVPYRRLDTIMRGALPNGFRPSDFNVLRLSLRGSELDALEGARETLTNIELIHTDLAFVEQYEGSPSKERLDAALAPEGFRPVSTVRTGPIGFGVYARV